MRVPPYIRMENDIASLCIVSDDGEFMKIELTPSQLIHLLRDCADALRVIHVQEKEQDF